MDNQVDAATRKLNTRSSERSLMLKCLDLEILLDIKYLIYQLIILMFIDVVIPVIGIRDWGH